MQTFLPISILLFNIIHGSLNLNLIQQPRHTNDTRMNDLRSAHVAGCADQHHILRKRFSDSNNCSKFKKYMKYQVIDLTSDTLSETSENEMPDQQTESTSLKYQSKGYKIVRVDQSKNIISITEKLVINGKIENRSIAARTSVNSSNNQTDVSQTNENAKTYIDEPVIHYETIKEKTFTMYAVDTASKLCGHKQSVQSNYKIQGYFSKMINDLEENEKIILKAIYKSLLKTFKFQASVEKILAHLVMLQKIYKFNVVTNFQCSKSSDECFKTSDMINKLDTFMQLANSGINKLYQIYKKVETHEGKMQFIEAIQKRQKLIYDLSIIKQDIFKDNEQVEKKKKALLTYQSNNKKQKSLVKKTTEALFINCTNSKALYNLYEQEINKIMSFTHSNITYVHIRKLIYNMPELLYYFAWNLNRIKQLNNIFAFEENKRRLCKEIILLKVIIDNLKLTPAYPCDSLISHAFRDSIMNFRNLIMDNLHTYVYQSTKYSLYKLAIYYYANVNHSNDPYDTLSYILFTLTFTLKSELWKILLIKFLKRLNINGFSRIESNKLYPRDFYTFLTESKQASSHIFYTLYLIIEFMEKEKGIMSGESIKDYMLITFEKICILTNNNPETQSINIKMLSFAELLTFFCNRLKSMSIRS